jgi:putative transposase
MGTLKNEMFQGGSFAIEADARIEIFNFIESYYHHHRKHPSLHYQTSAQFEAENQNKN